MTYFQVRGNKYHSKTTQVEGVTYHSKKEAAYADELRLRKMAHDIKDWQRQVCIPLNVNGYHIANYYIDFVVEHNDGTLEYVEVKGFETDAFRMKWRLFEALFSEEFAAKDYKITLVK